ncbi:hypothetical protein GWI33_007974 [Rhynchophorus ferrugineus]|uniref:Secreted protein n=1 Tax=Rhynchophorus ferrugineus TaxID=354439 RepID=A0A834IFD2_RHYFE|nr:hypothetical protein GWI33_007974 [Rhynchophorus ferrugineus]
MSTGNRADKFLLLALIIICIKLGNYEYNLKENVPFFIKVGNGANPTDNIKPKQWHGTRNAPTKNKNTWKKWRTREKSDIKLQRNEGRGGGPSLINGSICAGKILIFVRRCFLAILLTGRWRTGMTRALPVIQDLFYKLMNNHKTRDIVRAGIEILLLVGGKKLLLKQIDYCC